MMLCENKTEQPSIKHLFLKKPSAFAVISLNCELLTELPNCVRELCV